MVYVITTEKLPIKLWAPAQVQHSPLCEEYPEERRPIEESIFCTCQRGVIQQFRNLANHPLAFKQIVALPDYHLGFGMPIGAVFATQGGVVPNAVGVDIGCGMIAFPTQWAASDFSRDRLQELRVAIHRRVPVGNAKHVQARQLPQALLDLVYDPLVINKEQEASAYQLGTLGGGNHFIEIQSDEAGHVWIMIHSGSRGIGYKVCQHYHKRALGMMRQFHSAIPDPDLAFLPEGEPEYDDYLYEMRWCMTWAEENRQAMIGAIDEAFQEVTGESLKFAERDVVATHHNFVVQENHFGKNVWVHRKGAVKATGLVTIPGDMGTASYIARGLNPRESFNTCAHGAGRVLGRKQAKGLITHDEAVASMAHVVFGVREGEVDEMPRCYKNIDAVMAAQADLAEPVIRLLPLAPIKG